MMPYKTLNRLTLQNLVNAYSDETGHGKVVMVEEQNALQKHISQHTPILVLTLAPHDTVMAAPVDRVSQLCQRCFGNTHSILSVNFCNRDEFFESSGYLKFYGAVPQ